MTGTAALRYLADGAAAGVVRVRATSMFFAVPAAATAAGWANASHIQATKPRPLDPIGGST